MAILKCATLRLLAALFYLATTTLSSGILPKPRVILGLLGEIVQFILGYVMLRVCAKTYFAKESRAVRKSHYIQRVNAL